ncbi:Uncharacterised protein [Acinetobacter haemolyticus]|uniref:Uncharacterized protein n=1 Tax=Acinetobacter haemolyticus CIP 64.3 = MTCC 9819 TaxID=1217659 RepID=N9FA54_ACIHA|nr:hypothetical protein F927_01209 [Acinetobacter haemolyticus CIP 64.3 = MTCC 9819]QHI23039.1 hypothetical protein Ahae5227_09150 [Acinetobacter haemolyticus]SPT46684.1 Uncharacterised protein [Acinetobacter haemolyticus]SUU59542.1 Uncharacterised protein [Acinetobacter haemolyticus]
MSILNFGIFFVVLLIVGYFVHKTKWKLRYLTPLCFSFSFLLSLFVFSILFPDDWVHMSFFSINGPNQLAMYALFMSFIFSLLTTLSLIMAVWAARNNVF